MIDLSNIEQRTTREDFYKESAEGFATSAFMQRADAAVHVEGLTDIPFWKEVFKHFFPDKKFYFIAYSRCYESDSDGVTNSAVMASGSTHCLNYAPYLSKRFFICIDSDERYLTGEIGININRYIFQTYTYSIENHYCYAPKLNFGCVLAAGVDIRTFLPIFKSKIFDFEVFMKDFSNIIYELFLWHHSLAFTSDDELNVMAFNNIITTRGKIAAWQTKNNGEEILRRLRDRVRAKITKLQKNYPATDIEFLKKYYAGYGVTSDNVYMFIRGHHLMGMVSKIGEMCIERLLSDIKLKMGNDHKAIKKLHLHTKSFKKIAQRKIWFDNYYCMQKIQEDMDKFEKLQ